MYTHIGTKLVILTIIVDIIAEQEVRQCMHAETLGSVCVCMVGNMKVGPLGYIREMAGTIRY